MLINIGAKRELDVFVVEPGHFTFTKEEREVKSDHSFGYQVSLQFVPLIVG